jgi:hypothetical protein
MGCTSSRLKQLRSKYKRTTEEDPPPPLLLDERTSPLTERKTPREFTHRSSEGEEEEEEEEMKRGLVSDEEEVEAEAVMFPPQLAREPSFGHKALISEASPVASTAMSRCRSAPISTLHEMQLDEIRESLHKFNENQFHYVSEQMEMLLHNAENNWFGTSSKVQNFAANAAVEARVWLGHQALAQADFTGAYEHFQVGLQIMRKFIAESSNNLIFNRLKNLVNSLSHLPEIDFIPLVRHKIVLCIFRRSSVRQAGSGVGHPHEASQHEIDRFLCLMRAACAWIEGHSGGVFRFDLETEYFDLPINVELRNCTSRQRMSSLVSYPDWKECSSDVVNQFSEVFASNDCTAVFWPHFKEHTEFIHNGVRGVHTLPIGKHKGSSRGFFSISTTDVTCFNLEVLLQQFLEFYEVLFYVHPRFGYQGSRRHKFPEWHGSGVLSYFEFQLERICRKMKEFPQVVQSGTGVERFMKSRLERFLSSIEGCMVFNGFSGFTHHVEYPSFGVVLWRATESRNNILNLLLVCDFNVDSLDRCKLVTWRKLCSFFQWNLVVLIPLSSEFQRVPCNDFVEALESVMHDEIKLPWMIYAEGVGSLWLCQMLEDLNVEVKLRGVLSVNNSAAWKILSSSQCTFPVAVVVTDSLLTSSSILHIESSSAQQQNSERCFLEFPGASIGLDSLLHSFCIPWITSVYERSTSQAANSAVCSSPHKRRFSPPSQGVSSLNDWHPSISMAHLFELNRKSEQEGMFLKVKFSKDVLGNFLHLQLAFVPKQVGENGHQKPFSHRRNSWASGVPVPQPASSTSSGLSLSYLPENFRAVLVSSRQQQPITSWNIHRRNIETLNLPVEAKWRNPSPGFHCIFACIYPTSGQEKQESDPEFSLSQELPAAGDNNRTADSFIPLYMYQKSQKYSNTIDIWVS